MKEKERTVQTAVRMPESWLPRFEALAEKLGQTGITVSQAAVIRVALARGLDALEAEHGLRPDTAPQPAGAAPTSPSEPKRGDSKPARKPKPSK